MKRFSIQRQKVFDAVCSTRTHPTAEWIFDTVRKQLPKISLGTVYRNLAELKAVGKIIGFSDEHGIEHYDATVSPHVHFSCLQCGAIFDVPSIDLSPLREEIARSLGARVREGIVLYYGLCSDCLGQNKNQL